MTTAEISARLKTIYSGPETTGLRQVRWLYSIGFLDLRGLLRASEHVLMENQ